MRTRHRLVMLATVALSAATVLATVAGPASAAPTHRQSIAGTGTAVAARTVNAATLPTASTRATMDTPTAAPQRRGAALPSRPSTGRRGAAPVASASSANATSASNAIQPLVAPAVVANFAGTNQAASGCGGCEPPDVNAAVGATQIVEAVNLRTQVFSKTGVLQCSFGDNALLGNTTDSLSDPRVLYDNVNARWLFSITIVPASASATPALWVAASSSSNACGTWFIFRVTFSGGSFPAGTLLDYPISGQDRNALFLSTDNLTASGGENFTVFGLPKSALYTGGGFSFGAFNTASFTAPVSNGGIPMVSSTFNYFLGAVPGTGYRLYRMTNSGGAGATLTLQATISAPFSAPPRRVNQPGTSATLDPLDGRIAWSPVLASGGFIWFAHGIDDSGFPTVRYGAVNVNTNASGGMAEAFHSGTSDDFNPSIGVGNNPGGGAFIFVNWAFTDTANNVATSDTVDSVLPGGGVPNLIGTGTVLVNGAVTGEDRFGDYSSVAIDPTNANGSCAVTAQQYFTAGGAWATRIARVGTC